MIERILKTDFLNVVNESCRHDAPPWGVEPFVRTEAVKQHAFDVDDSSGDAQTIVRPFENGTASYINGKPNKPYSLRFVCYDDYMHQFVFDDGKGHAHVSLFIDGVRMADFLVYDESDGRKWFVVHELSKGELKNKRSRGRIQLSATLNMLCKCPAMKEFIDGFRNKRCILSAHDERVLTPKGMADAFMEAYTILPEPIEFNYGVINRFGFKAFETSKVILD